MSLYVHSKHLLCPKVPKFNDLIFMHPAQGNEARLGGVHLIFWHIQICTRLPQGELFKVSMYTAQYKLKRMPLFDDLLNFTPAGFWEIK